MDDGTLNHKSKLASQLVRLVRRIGHPAPPRALEGWTPLCQSWGACPRETKRKPSLHAKMELHLLDHAAFTRFCSRSGTDSAFAFARLRRKWAVSSDRGPPISTANTTSWARPPSPHQLWVPSSRRALRLPSSESHPAVVSTTSWAPLVKVNPSATTSSNRGRARRRLGSTLAPTSGHTWAATPASEHAAR